MEQNATRRDTDKLLVLRTSGDREVALKVAFMYAKNAKQQYWWNTVRLVVWGPSAKLLAEDEELQLYIKAMGEIGVELLACKACADRYGVSDALSSLGIEVLFMGEPLTEMLKNDWKVLTF